MDPNRQVHRLVRELCPTTVAALEQLVHVISRRVGRALERQGLLAGDFENSFLTLNPVEISGFDDLLGHSIIYRVALGPHQGRKTFTLRHGTGSDRRHRRQVSESGRVLVTRRGGVRGTRAGKTGTPVSLHHAPGGLDGAVVVNGAREYSLPFGRSCASCARDIRASLHSRRSCASCARGIRASLHSRRSCASCARGIRASLHSKTTLP